MDRRIKEIYDKKGARSFNLVLYSKETERKQRLQSSLERLHYLDSKLAFHLDVTFFQEFDAF